MNTPWSIDFSYDPYKRSRWYDNDEEWEAHLATLPPKPELKKEIKKEIKKVEKVVKNVWNISSKKMKKKVVVDDDFPILNKKLDKKYEPKKYNEIKYENEKSKNIRMNAFHTIQKSTNITTKTTTTKKKTKMCRNILNGKKCTYRICHFAHYIDELEPKGCAFENTCRYQQSTCFFIHPQESMDCFVERLGMQRFRR
jgi:hypothetical protein